MMLDGIYRLLIGFLFYILVPVAQGETNSEISDELTKRYPNVVLIVADDMGWNDVSFNGSEIQTPNLDKLAQEGIRLDRFYVQPACSPTRASLMTAKNNQSLGIYSPLSKLVPTGLPLKEKILPEHFKDAGYQTFLVGKWHLGFREEAYRPNSRGFDHFYGNLTGGIGYWDHVHGGGLDWQRNGETIREDGYVTRLQANEIESLIETRDRSKPIFLIASFNAPHLPNEAPEESIKKHEHILDPLRRKHAAMVSELDDAVGKLVTKLDKEGLLENTLIWFMSDNGGLNTSAFSTMQQFAANAIDTLSFGKSDIDFLEFIRVNVLEGRGSNMPFKRGKQSVNEGGVHVPSVVYWKDKLEAHVFDEMLTVQDVMPTLLHAADTRVSLNAIDGQSIWDYLSGKKSRGQFKPKDFVTAGLDGQAYYQYPWKLIARSNSEYELYRLDIDPLELKDLSQDNLEKVEELSLRLEALPRAESVHAPKYKSILNMDFFGGEEKSKPWVDVYSTD